LFLWGTGVLQGSSETLTESLVVTAHEGEYGLHHVGGDVFAVQGNVVLNELDLLGWVFDGVNNLVEDSPVH